MQKHRQSREPERMRGFHGAYKKYRAMRERLKDSIVTLCYIRSEDKCVCKIFKNFKKANKWYRGDRLDVFAKALDYKTLGLGEYPKTEDETEAFIERLREYGKS